MTPRRGQRGDQKDFKPSQSIFKLTKRNMRKTIIMRLTGNRLLKSRVGIYLQCGLRSPGSTLTNSRKRELDLKVPDLQESTACQGRQSETGMKSTTTRGRTEATRDKKHF